MESQSSALATSAGQTARKCCWPAGAPLSGWNGCRAMNCSPCNGCRNASSPRESLPAPKGSALRSRAMRQAYDTVTSILAAARDHQQSPLVMGLHPRHVRLVVDLLLRQRGRGLDARFFEIGYGAGMLLEQVGKAGFRFRRNRGLGGHASDGRRAIGTAGTAATARGQLPRHGPLRNRRPLEPRLLEQRSSSTYPRRNQRLACGSARTLVPGGQLVTITPNWHDRPADVTQAFCPPRTASVGLHLKEYTLREVPTCCGGLGSSRLPRPWSSAAGGCSSAAEAV